MALTAGSVTGADRRRPTPGRWIRCSRSNYVPATSELTQEEALIAAEEAHSLAADLVAMRAAIAERRVSSAIGLRGISRKILIFTLIGLARLLDVHVIGTPRTLRTATVVFYLSNEGISLIENDPARAARTSPHPPRPGPGHP